MIYLIIAISTIVFTIWTLFCGSIQIRCNDRDFNIEAKGWNDYTVEYSQIDSISYEENVLQNDNGYRTNGLGNLKYAMGNFKNDIFGDYIRYTHASCHSYGWLGKDGKTYYLDNIGYMVEGWNQVDGNWYYFYPGQGNKAVNTTIDTFYVNDQGVWVH